MVPIAQIRSGVQHFTDREMEAFKLSSECITVCEAARQLGTSHHSIEHARQRIADKLHVSRHQVTACAVRWFTWLECQRKR